MHVLSTTRVQAAVMCAARCSMLQHSLQHSLQTVRLRLVICLFGRLAKLMHHVSCMVWLQGEEAEAVRLKEARLLSQQEQPQY